MPRRSHSGNYPDDWKEISTRVKEDANWTCIRCGHTHEPATGYTLTTHHLDMNPSNNNWFNLAALCQRCHLSIQSKVVMERIWYLEHSEWFRPYVAGYYAYIHNLPFDKAYVMSRVDKLILLGQGRLDIKEFTDEKMEYVVSEVLSG